MEEFDKRITVNYEIKIPCICSECGAKENIFERHLFDFNKLNDHSERYIDQIICDKSSKQVELLKLLGKTYSRGENMASNNNNFYGPTVYTEEVKDSSITQNNYTNHSEIEKRIKEVTNNFNEKLDVIISKQDEAKINQEKVMEEALNEVQIWLNEIMSATGNAFELLDENEQRRFEDLKGTIEKANTKEDWDSTLTLVFPLLDKIGIKLESKTKIKDLNDLKEKLKGLIWKKNKSKEIDDNDPNKQLDK